MAKRDYFWDSGLMAVNPNDLHGHASEIITVDVTDVPDFGPIVTVLVKRLNNGVNGIVTLQRACCPLGDDIEEVPEGELPAEIKRLLAEFGMVSLQELVERTVQKPIPVSGLYFQDHHLVAFAKPLEG